MVAAAVMTVSVGDASVSIIAVGDDDGPTGSAACATLTIAVGDADDMLACTVAMGVLAAIDCSSSARPASIHPSRIAASNPATPSPIGSILPRCIRILPRDGEVVIGVVGSGLPKSALYICSMLG